MVLETNLTLQGCRLSRDLQSCNLATFLLKKAFVTLRKVTQMHFCQKQKMLALCEAFNAV